MDASSFDRMLIASGQTALDDNPAVRQSLLAVTQQAERESRRPARRINRLVPGLALGALAVTGAAAVWVTSVQPDVVVPVAYTTDSGRAVECVVYLEVPDPAIRAHLETIDWDGVGQRIYDEALAASVAPRADGLTFDSAEARESWSWFEAVENYTLGTIPAALLPERAVVAASDSSCAGDLH